nr:MAG TPA: hypothetical protein [Caudoviricetes sp.]
MNTEKLLAGKWEMTVGKVLFPAELLGDITVNYGEGTLEAETQAGTRKQPSGKASDAEITFTLFLPSLDYVKKAFDVADTDPMIFGGGNCKGSTPQPIHIHQLCAGKDAKDDFHVYAGLIERKFNPTLSTSDAAQIELTVQMQPTTDGYLLLGYPDPKTPQYWDVSELKWKAKPASP